MYTSHSDLGVSILSCRIARDHEVRLMNPIDRR